MALVAAAVYLRGVAAYRARFPGRPFSALRVVCFLSGLAIMTAAIGPPLDGLADGSFGWHMLQHLLLAMVGVPLLLLGAPYLLCVAAVPRAAGQRLTSFAHSRLGAVLFAPVTGWLAFIAVMWGAHFSPLYEASLEHPGVHWIEHVLFVSSALLFWSAVIQVGFAPRPVAFAARMLFLFLALPQGAFVAFAIAASRYPMYPHYVQAAGSSAAALLDQRNGADLMWIAGGFLLFCAFMGEAAAWAAAERKASPA